MVGSHGPDLKVPSKYIKFFRDNTKDWKNTKIKMSKGVEEGSLEKLTVYRCIPHSSLQITIEYSLQHSQY
jgi:hypothetical protein